MKPSNSSVYVEISPLLASPLAGIGRFAARLVETLSRAMPLHLVNLARGELAASLRLSNALPYGQEIHVPRGDMPAVDTDLDLWVRSLLRRRQHTLNPQTARHCPGVFTMLRPSARHFAREVCILYDFTPLILPWAHVREIREQFGKFFAETSSLCDKALAISQATKNDASWLCAIPNDDVIVSYPGPSLCVQSHAFAARVARSRNLILVVSTLEPRKNGQFLLDWFMTTDVIEPGTRLCWVGPKGWLSDLSSQNRKLESRGRRVEFFGMVPDKRLCQFYRQATFTIYPSLYEGFGFPVLDSLRHGAPVLSSFNSSLQEFAGDGVFYFDPCEESSLDAACTDLFAKSPFTIQRDDLDDKFSWDRLAKTIMSLCFTC